MFENFKTDIIYYNTATDFELEFNLCGCCRMRLFNDKCTDKKSLLLSLSRAVSRSRVIIITAPLFSDDNIMQTVASAIGGKTAVIDNEEYNITSENDVTIFEGGLPLVTEDGTFGGCIIESGPQSLILLTDNKSVRKSIMKNLLHQYIADIAMANTENKNDLVADDEETDSENSAPIAEEAEAPTEEPAKATEEPPEELVIDDNDTTDTSLPYEPEIEGLYTETTSDSYNDDDDGDYYCDDDYYTDEPAKKPSPFNKWLLAISIILLLTLAVLCYCIFYVPTTQGVSPSAYLKDIFDTLFK